MSIRIRSGASERDIATPFTPSSAITTSNPRRLSRRESMSQFSGLSSTIRILGIGGFRRSSVARVGSVGRGQVGGTALASRWAWILPSRRSKSTGLLS